MNPCACRTLCSTAAPTAQAPCPRQPGVGPDQDRGTRRKPAWVLRHPNPKYRWDAYNPDDSRPLEVQHRVNATKQRQNLLQHVKQCKKCRLFGGHVHQAVGSS